MRTRKDILFAAMSAVKDGHFSDHAIQIMMFVLTMDMPQSFTEHDWYKFTPSTHGPYCEQLNNDIKQYMLDGLMYYLGENTCGLTPESVVLSFKGNQYGQSVLHEYTNKPQKFLKDLSAYFCESLMTRMLENTYKLYPHMHVHVV